MMAQADDSLSDLRAAWQSKMPAEMRVTRERLERKAAHETRRLQMNTVAVVVVCLAEMVAFGVLAVRIHDPARRVGAVLISVGALYLAYEIWKHLKVLRALEARCAGRPSLVFYRALFTQMRDWSSRRWFWRRWIAIAPGPLLYSWAGMRQGEPPVLFYIFVGLLLLAIVLNMFVAVPRMQRRIDALNRVANGD
jgi:hypothetical protein